MNRLVKVLKELGDTKVDVALLCVPTRAVPTVAKEYLEKGIHTVDSYDVHGDVWNQVELLDTYAKEAVPVQLFLPVGIQGQTVLYL